MSAPDPRPPSKTDSHDSRQDERRDDERAPRAKDTRPSDREARDAFRVRKATPPDLDESGGH